MEKMTRMQMFELLLTFGEVQANPVLVEKLNHEIELINNKKSSSKETKTQVENKGIMETILNTLVEIAKPVTITELQNASEEMAQYSNQKLSALLKKLVESGQVEKTTDKKKSYFSAK